MPKSEKLITFPRRGQKNLWHPYGLQGLRTDRFIYVANRILRGQYTLIKLSSEPVVQS